MIDTHAHLNFPDLAEDVKGILERASAVNVTTIIVPGTDVESSLSGVNLSAVYDNVWAAIGIHPSDVSGWNDDGRVKFKEALLGATPPVAIGEVGLDYYHSIEEKDLQQTVLREMALLAKENSLPLIIHCREAFDDCYGLLKEIAPGHPTVIHCFTDGKDEAFKWLDAGYLISLTGIITYKKNTALRDVVSALPLDRLMLETDAPFLAPEGHRGERCEPRFVANVAQCLADLFNTNLEYIDARTTQTAQQFFNISQ